MKHNDMECDQCEGLMAASSGDSAQPVIGTEGGSESQQGAGDGAADDAAIPIGDGVQPWEAEQPRVVKGPKSPSKLERELHELTHCPPRSWCEDCVRGQSKDDPHRLVLCGAYSGSTVPRVSMDYAYLKEDAQVSEDEHAETVSARLSMTVLVLQETVCGSVWGYAVEAKGASDVKVAEQIADDIATIGMTKERIILKADQENSITDMHKKIVEIRSDFGTGIEQSKVGDSNSNGRIERAIQDYKGLVRTLRSMISRMINHKISLTHPIVPWLVRHVGHLITMCRVRDHGKTAYQEMKGRRTTAKLVPFGERVLFKIPKTKHMPGDFEDRWEAGIWLGFMMRSGEHLVGLSDGVYKCATVRRVVLEKRWSKELMDSIVGIPMEPVPGKTRRVTAYAKKAPEPTATQFQVQAPQEQEVRPFHIYKSDIVEFGKTDGCLGCRALMGNSNWRAKHSAQCRKRVEEQLSKTETGSKRVKRA